MPYRWLRVLMATRIAVVVLLGGVAVGPGYGVDPAVSSTRPLQADLVGPLDVSGLKEGMRVSARVVEDWKGADCRLVRGALVQGRIVQVARRSKTEKGSSFQVLFDL